MRLEAKDAIALALIVLAFIGLYLEKLPLPIFTALISAIVGFYFGYRIAHREMEKRGQA